MNLHICACVCVGKYLYFICISLCVYQSLLCPRLPSWHAFTLWIAILPADRPTVTANWAKIVCQKPSPFVESHHLHEMLRVRKMVTVGLQCFSQRVRYWRSFARFNPFGAQALCHDWLAPGIKRKGRSSSDGCRSVSTGCNKAKRPSRLMPFPCENACGQLSILGPCRGIMLKLNLAAPTSETCCSFGISWSSWNSISWQTTLSRP
jgi:hypothetical protein